MIKSVYIIILTGMALSCVPKQEPSAGPDQQPVLNQEIDQVVRELYSSINYDGVTQPDWDMMRSVFVEGAYLIPVGDTSYTRFSVEDFIDLYKNQIESGLIISAAEYEIYRTGDAFGNIAQVFSTYETKTITPKDTLRKRGINSIQLLKADGKWRIVSIIWYDENEEAPIPERYLRDR